MRRAAFLLLFLIPACNSAPEPAERYKAERLPSNDASQADLIRRAEDLYWIGGEEYDKLVEECAKDPAVTQKLTMLMFVHMDDTERNQRNRQGTEFQLRSLEQNIPYCRARATILKLGLAALPVVEELVRHPRSEIRRRGIEVVSLMPPDVLPGVEARFDACPPKSKRHFVEAVAAMKPCPESELLLLRWSKSEEFSVRAASFEGLAALGTKHRKLLCAVVREDEDPFVRRQVVKSLGRFRDRTTVSTIVDYYEKAEKSGDQQGVREAERTMIRISKLPPTRNGRILRYGLTYWKKWLRTVPFEGENR